jgi:hypothetical protein
MPTVVQLPNGSFAMTLEDCKVGQDANQACLDYLKSSPDGQDWSPVSSMGVPIEAAGGHRLLHTPTLAWSAFGGPNGTLIVSGQRVVVGSEGALKVMPQSGRVLMVNTNFGVGPWREIAAPVRIDPTGGYGAGETACPGYSSAVVASSDPRDSSFVMLAGTAIANGKCEIRVGTGSLAR